MRLTLAPPVIRRGSKIKPKKKFIRLNLNSYRNNNHFKNASDKIKYEDFMRPFILEAFADQVIIPPIKIQYSLVVGTKRKLDIANILTIVDKFFCDTLVKCEIIEDDNFDYIQEIVYKYGGYQKNDEKILIEVSFNNTPGVNHE